MLPLISSLPSPAALGDGKERLRHSIRLCHLHPDYKQRKLWGWVHLGGRQVASDSAGHLCSTPGELLASSQTLDIDALLKQSTGSLPSARNTKEKLKALGQSRGPCRHGKQSPN